MAPPQLVARNNVYLVDPAAAGNAVKPNADGSINVDIVGITPGIAIPTAAPTFLSAGAGQFGVAVTAGAAVALPSIPADAKYAQININGVNMRYRDDGVDPTSAIGYPVYVAASWLYGGPLAALKFIAQTGSGSFDVLYYK